MFLRPNCTAGNLILVALQLIIFGSAIEHTLGKITISASAPKNIFSRKHKSNDQFSDLEEGIGVHHKTTTRSDHNVNELIMLQLSLSSSLSTVKQGSSTYFLRSSHRPHSAMKEEDRYNMQGNAIEQRKGSYSKSKLKKVKGKSKTKREGKTKSKVKRASQKSNKKSKKKKSSSKKSKSSKAGFFLILYPTACPTPENLLCLSRPGDETSGPTISASPSPSVTSEETTFSPSFGSTFSSTTITDYVSQASPFNVQYEYQGNGIPDDTDMQEASDVTIQYLNEFFSDYFGSDKISSFVSSPTLSSKNPTIISYEYQIEFTDDIVLAPSQDDIDKLLQLAFTSTSVDALLTSLANLDSSNPISGTTAIWYSPVQATSTSSPSAIVITTKVPTHPTATPVPSPTKGTTLGPTQALAALTEDPTSISPTPSPSPRGTVSKVPSSFGNTAAPSDRGITAVPSDRGSTAVPSSQGATVLPTTMVPTSSPTIPNRVVIGSPFKIEYKHSGDLPTDADFREVSKLTLQYLNDFYKEDNRFPYYESIGTEVLEVIATPTGFSTDPSMISYTYSVEFTGDPKKLPNTNNIDEKMKSAFRKRNAKDLLELLYNLPVSNPLSNTTEALYSTNTTTATPFVIEYVHAVGIPSDSDLTAASNITLLLLSDYLKDNKFPDSEISNIIASTDGFLRDPSRISYMYQVEFSGNSKKIPDSSSLDANINRFFTRQKSDLLAALADLPAVNPISNTTEVLYTT